MKHTHAIDVGLWSMLCRHTIFSSRHFWFFTHQRKTRQNFSTVSATAKICDRCFHVLNLNVN